MRLLAIFALGTLTLGGFGCIVDGAAPCGEGRVVGALGTCICRPGMGDSPSDTECRPIADGGSSPAAVDASNGDAGDDRVPDGDTGTPVTPDGGAGQQAPTGIGATCASHVDCAQFDATYCESFQTHQCLIEHCSLQPDDCPSGHECCDFSALGLDNTLCVPATSCPTR